MSENPTQARRFGLDQFVRETEQRSGAAGFFELETERVLEVNLNGLVWTKRGSMVAYVGDIKFKREGIFEHGLGRLLKSTLSGETTPLTKAEGTGRLYLADQGKKISIIDLNNEAIVVNGSDMLAFEPQITWDVKLMKKLTSLIAGGLFNIRLEGTGMVAISTHFEPLTLRVTPDQPVITDPNATVAWSGNLSPNFRKDLTIGTFFGRGSGEVIQMEFSGSDGFVVIQPVEEGHMQSGAS